MVNTFFGTKVKQSQAFDRDGRRIPVTVISADPCWITQVKSIDTDGYTAVQVGFGTKSHKHLTKPQKGHIKKAELEKQAPRFFREIHVVNNDKLSSSLKVGDKITVGDVIHPGDTVQVTGTSKGKGFAGVMKRWRFAGGPATHGQSDRKRAPGSIGGTATPGRVYKGKRMAGRMGRDTVTVSNLQVVSVDTEKNELTIAGLVPGHKQSVVAVKVTKPSGRTGEPLSDKLSVEKSIEPAKQEADTPDKPKE